MPSRCQDDAKLVPSCCQKRLGWRALWGHFLTSNSSEVQDGILGVDQEGVDDVSVNFIIFTVVLDVGPHRPRISLCLAVLRATGGRSLALHPDDKTENLMHNPLEEGLEFREEAQNVIPIGHIKECPQGIVLEGH